MFKKLLVPVDGTTTCNKAFVYSIKIAQKFNSEIVLFNAQEIAPTIAWVNDPIVYSQTAIDPEQIAADILAIASKSFEETEIMITTKFAIGDAAHAILDACDELQCDAIIMATHGNKAIKRFLLGSVTDKIVHHAKVSVIVVR